MTQKKKRNLYSRVLAMFLAFVLVFNSSGFAVLAEEPETQQAVLEMTEAATEAPVTEAPATEEQTTEAPATETPITEAPATEEQTTEAPVTEAPVTEAPATEEQTTEAPVTEAPATEEQTTEAPTTEEPETEAETTEVQTTEAPVTEAPATEEQTTEAPGTEEAVTESESESESEMALLDMAEMASTYAYNNGRNFNAGHIDIGVNVTAVLNVNGKTLTTPLRLSRNDFTSGNVTVTATQGGKAYTNFRVNLNNLSSSTGQSGVTQVRVGGTYPTGSQSNPVYYTFSLTKTVTFENGDDDYTVDITFSSTFSFWDSNNDCPGLRSGDAGLDFILGTGTGSVGYIYIQKNVTDGEEQIATSGQTYTFDIYKEDGTLVDTLTAKVNTTGIGLAQTDIAPGTYYIVERTPVTEIGNYEYKSTKITVNGSERNDLKSSAAKVEAGDTVTFTVDNIYKKEEVSISGTKVWSDNGNANGSRPQSITVRLWNGSTEVDSQVVTPDADGNWTWSFTGLPKYNGSQLITYTVTEDTVDGYTTLISPESVALNSTDSEYGATITNTLKTGRLELKKTVVSPDVVITDSFNYIVSGNFGDGVTEVYDAAGNDYIVSGSGAAASIIVPVPAGGSVVLVDLPAGETFTVTEDGMVNGTVTVGGHTYTAAAVNEKTRAQIGIGTTETVEYRNTIADTELVMIVKNWEDQNDAFGLRPEEKNFEVVLTALDKDGNETEFTCTTSVTWHQDGNRWSVGLKDVPAYDADGNKITYKVTETGVGDHYELSENSTLYITPANEDGREVTLTNTLRTGEVTVTKIAEGLTDEQFANLEDEFRFTLKDANGVVAGVHTLDVRNVKGVWTASYTFEDLPYGDYTLTEEVVGGGEHAWDVTAGASKETAAALNGTTYAVTVSEEAQSVSVTYVNRAQTVEIKDFTKAGVTAVKKLTGHDMTEGEFWFVIMDESGKLVGIGKNNAAAEVGGVAESSVTFYAAHMDGNEIVLADPSTPVLSFNEVGTYQYVVREVTPTQTEKQWGGFEAHPGVTYDASVYTFTVKVTIGNDGKLQADIELPAGGMVFNNSYDTENASIILGGRKTLEAGNRVLQDGEFTFEIVEVKDAQGTELEGAEPVQVQNGAAGYFSHTLTFGDEDEGYHYYKVTEVIPENADGITYDETTYIVTILVTDNQDGTLTVTCENEDPMLYSGLNFTNVYDVEEEFDITVEKHLQGRVLKAGEFQFTIENVTENAPMPAVTTVSNTADGKITFTGITYTENDIGKTYTYAIREVIPAEADKLNGVTYDDTAEGHLVIVKVEDGGDGTLIVTQTQSAVITNSFSQGSRDIIGTKTWKDGGAAHDNAQDVTIHLYRTTATDVTKETVWEQVKNEDGTPLTPAWGTGSLSNRYWFLGLPVYDETGAEYIYSVYEDSVNVGVADGDSYEISYDSSRLHITNTLVGTTKISGTKTWVDGGKTHNNAQDILLTLSRRIAGGQWTNVAAEAVWNGDTYTFSNLAKYDANGYAYQYRVEETIVCDGDYATAVVPNADYSQWDFTNTLKTGNLELKKLVQSATDISDSFEFVVSGDFGELTEVKDSVGKTYPVTDGTITVSVPADASVELMDIPTGSYTVSEKNAVNDEVVVAGHTYQVIGNGQTAQVAPGETAKAEIINIISDEKMITFTKEWVDQDNTYGLRPSTTEFMVTLQGYVKEVEYGEENDVSMAVWSYTTDGGWFTDGNTWTFLMGDVPAYDAYGNKITYVVTEDGADDYISEILPLEITPADGTVSVELENTLKTGDLTISKEVSGLSAEKLAALKDTFRFSLVSEDITLVHTLAAGESYTFEDIPLGTYTVTEEVIGGLAVTDSKGQTVLTQTHAYDVYVNGKALDGTSYTAEVTAEDTAAVTVAYENKVQKVSITAEDLAAKKILTGRDLAAGEFTFRVWSNDELITEGKNAAAKDGQEAAIVFDQKTIEYDTVGVYHYEIREMMPTESIPGVTYDPTVYDITVTVTVDENGDLQAVRTPDEEFEFVFNNTYDAKATSIILRGQKELAGGGREVKKDEFSFHIVEVNADGTVKENGVSEVVSNDAAGNFHQMFTYDTAGDYYYKVSEVIPEEAVLDSASNTWTLNGVTYDTTEYLIHIQVTDNNQTAELVAAFVPADGQDAELFNRMAFENVFDAEGTYSIQAKKVLEGRDLKDGEFTFELKAVTEGAPMPADTKVTNAADGSIIFPAITFTEEHIGKVFEYKISEQAGTLGGVTYDTTPEGHTVEVKVTYDEATGKLVIAQETPISGDHDVPTIYNRFDQGKLYVTGTKTWLDGGKTHDNAKELVLELKRSTDGETWEAVAGAEPTWVGNTYYFLNLPKFDMEGTVYLYKVEETAVNVTLAEGDAYTTTYDGQNMINKLTGTVEVQGSKTWADGGKEHDNAKDITLILKRTSNKPGAAEEIVDAKPVWTEDVYTFSNLEKYDAEGYTYTYKVEEEINIEGEWSMEAKWNAQTNGYDFTNTLKTGNLTLEKKVQAEETITDSFTFLVSGNFENLAVVTDTNGNTWDIVNGSAQVQVPANGTVTLTDIPTGSYVVTEAEIQGGRLTVGTRTYTVDELSVSVQVNPGETSLAVMTNIISTVTDLMITKNWADQDNKYGLRPEADEFTVTLVGTVKEENRLYGETPDTTRYEYTAVAEWNENGSVWTVHVSNIPMYDIYGNMLTYEVTETVVDGYVQTVPENGAAAVITPAAGEKAAAFTNTLETGNVSISKTVTGLTEAQLAALQDDFRFVLKSEDGTELVRTLNAGESYTFTDVPAGIYTVTEQVIGGMTAEDGSIAQTYAYTPAVTVDGVAQNGPEYKVEVSGDTDSIVAVAYENKVQTTELQFTSTTLRATKTLTGRDLSEGEFTFEVLDDSENVITTGTNKAAADGSAAVIEFAPSIITYDAIGTYYYAMREVVPAQTLGGITYDPVRYVFSVEVFINEDGELTAEMSEPEKVFAFANTYETGTASIILRGHKTLEGRALKADEFSFRIVEVQDVQGTAMDGAVPVIVKNGAAGYFGHELQYVLEDEGLHYYKVTEVPATNNGEASAAETGMTYAATEYIVCINVADDGNGVLSAAFVPAEGQNLDLYQNLDFTNVYTAEGEYQIKAEKNLEGRTLKDDEFEFILEAVTTGAPMPDAEEGEAVTAKNKADSSITFPVIRYTQEDIDRVYTYRVREVQGSLNGVTYDTDPTGHIVEVTVKDAGNGQLTIEQKTLTDGQEKPVITNTFNAGTVEIEGTKTWVDGEKAHDNAEEVKLTLKRTIAAEPTEADWEEVLNVTAQWGTGEMSNTYHFAELPKYDPEGSEYRYAVEEAAVEDYTTSYDGNHITNTIIDTEDKELSGTKTWIDGGAEHDNAAEVKLTLYRKSADPAVTEWSVAEGAVPVWAENVYTFENLELYDDAGFEYAYKVEETRVEGYEEPEYDTVNPNNITNRKEQDEKEDPKKTGSASGDAVEAGQEITYEISYYNHNNQPADVIITDKLDDGVDFVSADSDGSYDAATHTVTWKLVDAEPFAEGNVSVTVKVNESARKADEGEADAAISNQAGVRIGHDAEVKTNVVENPVPNAAVQVKKVDATTGEMLAGATLRLTDAAGNLVEQWITTTEAHTVKGLALDVEYTLTEVKAPDNYKIAEPITFKAESYDKVVEVVMEDEREIAEDAVLTVTKNLTYEGTEVKAEEATFYVALFADAQGSKRISDVKALTFKDASSSKAAFDNLELERTYYVFETDEQGNAQNAGKFYQSYFADGNVVEVTADVSAYAITFENQLTKLPEGYEEIEEEPEETEKETEEETEAKTEAESEKKTTAVKTGDDTPLMSMMLMFAASAMSLLMAAIFKRRRTGN